MSRPGGARWLPWVVAIGVLVAPVVFGVASAAPVAPAVAPTAPPAGVPSTPFATRAGFDPTRDAAVADIGPASGTIGLVVEFVATDPAFYAPPPTGAPPMSPGQIAAVYGLSPATYASVEAYFQGYGLQITHVWPDRLSLSVSGPAGAVGLAFHTTLLRGTYDGRSVQFPGTPPGLPPALESEVTAVVGLSSGFTTFTLPLALDSSGLGPAAGSPSLITPGIARQIYGASALYNYTGTPTFATGETIALLLWGDGYAPSDLATFFGASYPSTFPAVKITPYPVDGAPLPNDSAPSDPSTAPQELTLDLEWSGSLAPGANLAAVYAPDGPASNGYSPTVASMTDALNEAVTGIPGVDVISMSFGTPEGSGGGLASAWANDIAEAMHERITLVAATGDNGGYATYDPCTGGPTPEYPAADPYVLAVGGTAPTLATNPLGQVTGIASEPAWAGSGGGFSTEFADPAYQQVGSAAAPVEAAGHRGLPDVAAAAANDYVYYAGAARTGQGTSFATPLWAGLLADMDAQRGSPLGFVNGNLYAIGAAEPAGHLPIGMVDVTSGGNCLGPAGVGWDTATGWGTPRGVALYADLTSSIVNVTLATAPDPSAPGGSVTISAVVTNETDGAPVSGIPVSLVLSADTSIGICQGRFGASIAATNGTGVATATFSIPACYLGTKAVATAEVTSDGLYGSASRLLPVNLLGYLPFLGSLAQPPYDALLYVAILGGAIAAGWAIGRPPPPRSPATSRRSATAPSPPAGAYGPPATDGGAPAPAPGGPPPSTSGDPDPGSAPPGPPPEPPTAPGPPRALSLAGP